MTALQKIDQFPVLVQMLASELMESTPIHTGEWQAMDTSQSKIHATYELVNTQLSVPVPESVSELIQYIRPTLPWAEEHFEERVSGIPYNPAPSHVRWPYAVRGNADHTDANTTFSHTYPERFWPKHAAHRHPLDVPYLDDLCGGTPGIRFHYGDLRDVVDLLTRSPLTRQAYLPVWFPEDTGAVDKQRVPCTLGYHFMIRGNGNLHCWYAMRSCDIIRHFRNDVYMAGRLMQWVCAQINHTTDTGGVPESWPFDQQVWPGNLHMTISSLHAFLADHTKLVQVAAGTDD